MTFARKSLLLSISQVTVIGLGALSSVVLYRAMGPSGAGQFNLFRAVGSLGAAGLGLGIGNASVYYIRTMRVPVPNVLGTLCGYLLVLVLPVTVVVAATVMLVPSYFGVVPLSVALAFGIGTASLVGTSTFRMVFVAQLAARQLSATSLAPVVILLLSAGALALIHQLTAHLAISLYAAAQLITLLHVLGYLRDDLRSRQSFNWSLLGRFVSYGSRLYAANVLLLLSSTAGIFVLRHYTPEDFTEIGLFAAAAGISGYISVPTAAISPLLYAKWGGQAPLQRGLEVERVARLNAAFGVVASLGAIALGEPALRLLFGEAYVPAQPALNLMAPAVSLISFYAVFDSLLASAGRAGVSAWIFSLACPASIGMTALLAPRMGFVGLAMSTLLTNGAIVIAALLVCRRLFGIHPLRCLLIRRSDVGFLRDMLRAQPADGAVPAVKQLMMQQGDSIIG